MPLLKHVGFQFYVENVACFIMLGFVIIYQFTYYPYQIIVLWSPLIFLV